MKVHDILIIFFVASAMALFSSCEEEIRYVGQYDGEKLVLFCCANTDTTVTARLFKSKYFQSRSDEGSCFDMLFGAEVTLEADGRRYAMDENPEKPGEYTCGYWPDEGDGLMITASLAGFGPVRSEASVPQRPDFSVESCNVEYYGHRDDEMGRSSELYRIMCRVTLRDDPAAGNYYRVCMSRLGQKVLTYSDDALFVNADSELGRLDGLPEIDCSLSLKRSFFEDSAINGREYSFNLWVIETGYSLADIDLDEYAVEIASVSEDLYRYEKSTPETVLSGKYDYLFSEQYSISNNIQGGIGCFGAMASRALILDSVHAPYQVR